MLDYLLEDNSIEEITRWGTGPEGGAGEEQEGGEEASTKEGRRRALRSSIRRGRVVGQGREGPRSGGGLVLSTETAWLTWRTGGSYAPLARPLCRAAMPPTLRTRPRMSSSVKEILSRLPSIRREDAFMCSFSVKDHHGCPVSSMVMYMSRSPTPCP